MSKLFFSFKFKSLSFFLIFPFFLFPKYLFADNHFNFQKQDNAVLTKVAVDREDYFFKENEKKLLQQLEIYESYRPASCSDMTRNPFNIKRYKFNFNR